MKARTVSPELVAARAGRGLALMNGTGRPIGAVKLPATLRDAGAPSWSPDGTRIAFTANTSAPAKAAFPLPPTDVYVVGLDGGTPRRITTGRDALSPTWSPDGRWVAYTVARLVAGKRSASIWIVHPDGSDAHALTAERAGVFDLAGPYNPVTGVIAFTRCVPRPIFDGGMEPDGCSVWTMRPDGSHQRRLAGQSEEPAWSPDGRRIVFASARDHAAHTTVGEDEQSWIRQLYVMDADGSDQHRLLVTRTNDTVPSWAPGGRVIAYETTTGAMFQTTVAFTNADGSCRRTIPPPATPKLNEGYLTPTWRPGGDARTLPACSDRVSAAQARLST